MRRIKRLYDALRNFVAIVILLNDRGTLNYKNLGNIKKQDHAVSAA